MAREMCPAILMITSSRAPDSASFVTSVWRIQTRKVGRQPQGHWPLAASRLGNWAAFCLHRPPESPACSSAFGMRAPRAGSLALWLSAVSKPGTSGSGVRIRGPLPGNLNLDGSRFFLFMPPGYHVWPLLAHTARTWRSPRAAGVHIPGRQPGANIGQQAASGAGSRPGRHTILPGGYLSPRRLH